MKLAHLTAREILDSRGLPTVEAEVCLEDGTKALGQVPAGSSRGKAEATELRDENVNRYLGMGVLKSVDNIKGLAPLLVGKEVDDQFAFDRILLEADGTEDKSNLGGNSLLAISMAVCRAMARSRKVPLFAYFASMMNRTDYSLPEPMILLLEGGKHGDWTSDVQEFMVMPSKRYFGTFSERLRVGVEVYHTLHQILLERKYATGVGLEGAFCPRELSGNEEALNLIIEAVKRAGFVIGEQVGLVLDVASSEFYEDGRYFLKSEGRSLNVEEWREMLINWTQKYPIWSLEDMFQEEGWASWNQFYSEVQGKVQVVGDDLITTHVDRIQKAAEEKCLSAVIIKPNQVGTITETLDAIKKAEELGLTIVVSHRGAEANDDLIADLVIGVGGAQCKFGAPVRGERVAKYNRLLRIEEKLLQSS